LGLVGLIGLAWAGLGWAGLGCLGLIGADLGRLGWPGLGWLIGLIWAGWAACLGWLGLPAVPVRQTWFSALASTRMQVFKDPDDPKNERKKETSYNGQM
jgi:hypothetical protein